MPSANAFIRIVAPANAPELQGLFLKRQREVSAQFANFMVANVLTAPQLWEELLTGTRSAGFWKLLALRVYVANILLERVDDSRRGGGLSAKLRG